MGTGSISQTNAEVNTTIDENEKTASQLSTSFCYFFFCLYMRTKKKHSEKHIKYFELIKTLKGHDGIINSVSFSSDGSKVVSSSNDNTIRIWDVESGKQIKILHYFCKIFSKWTYYFILIRKFNNSIMECRFRKKFNEIGKIFSLFNLSKKKTSNKIILFKKKTSISLNIYNEAIFFVIVETGVTQNNQRRMIQNFFFFCYFQQNCENENLKLHNEYIFFKKLDFYVAYFLRKRNFCYQIFFFGEFTVIFKVCAL
ncbi:WD repeat-containing protein [Reticulomyxa filosa]|uniref:WD repeat-containing protein n=1 Tax=Reticulomyxa filosa TaxID=46433 RepID=X6M990_RETFI|nr:WD repeat-containing protein [Reticulomyxa filosa]|eukprot:ETO09585.1 WD repeat-containing protein [Reticulomyxa filosa]